ncbi:MAG: uroporphyrinogen-III synthase [Bacteroidales bacterium]|nr:uroporphyrinogen-III synthase [Bacteroidales bacterium]
MAKSIKNILISQNAPAEKEQSQYNVLAQKYNLNLTFNKFFEVVRISNKEYRAQRINLLDYPAVIMTSKMAVDNYFHFANEMRLKIPDDMKFFCITDSIANYLQTYIQYRKRKIFYGKLTFDELITVIQKHKEEKYLFPCAEDASPSNFKKLEAAKINYTKIVMHRSEPKDLSKINIKKFDMVVMFAPIGVKSFIQNFPDVTSDDITIAAFGKPTQTALQRAKLKVTVSAPTVKCPSMIMALENFFEEGTNLKAKKETNKKVEEKNTVKKASSSETKKTTTKSVKVSSAKKTAPVAKETKTTVKKTTSAAKATKTTAKKATAKKKNAAK